MHFTFLEKLGASVLIVMWVLWGGDKIGNYLVHAAPSPLKGSLAGEETQEAGAKTNEPAKPLPELLAEATPDAGAKVFKKCTSCHTAEAGAGNKVGPNLHNVLGRDIASVSGFAYSSAMTEQPGDWTYEKLDQFLTKPPAVVKGTKMTFAGLPSPVERAAVIAYLRSQTDSPPPLP
jgi:cytochrome c